MPKNGGDAAGDAINKAIIDVRNVKKIYRVGDVKVRAWTASACR
jgi:hypothetical protein